MNDQPSIKSGIFKKKEEWKTEFENNKYPILVSFIFLVIALSLNYLAGNYVDRAETVSASDLILDHIPPINLTFIFIYGYLIVLLVLLIYPVLFNIKDFHIVISQFSLLVLIRSFFITLTHLRVPADAIIVNASFVYNLLVFQNDLFFSGHTAIPFLGFLLFRKEKIGILFLIATIVLASTVLLMHAHYSIDVFAAFFITYGSYKLSNWFFKKVKSTSQMLL